ncbi:MAG: ATP-binding protein, partial [Sulfolobales archaeon]
MFSRLFGRNRDSVYHRVYVEDDVFEHGNKFICGYELIRKKSGKDDELDPEIMTSFIDTIRSKIPRSLSLYIVTQIKRYYGGSYIICIDKNERVRDLCELIVSTLETLSKGRIKSKKLRDKEIKDLVLLEGRQLGEVSELHSLYAETIDLGDISYSIKLDNIFMKESIFLGETSRTKIKTPYSISTKDLLRHVAIFGSTGSGKSTTAATIAYRAYEKNFDVYILDWHGEYRSLLRRSVREFKLRHLVSLESLPVFRDPVQLLEVFETVFELTPSQSYILSRVLRRIRDYEFDFKRLYEEISMFPEEARWVSESKLALLRKFESLVEEDVETEDKSLSLLIDDSSKNRIVSIDLSEIERSSTRSLASLLIIKSIVLNASSKRENSRERIIVVDEAHHVFKRSEGSNVIKDTLAEVRKYGVGMILVTQSPSSVGEDILKNTNTKIIHSIRSDADKKILREATSISKEFEDMMSLLDVGEAIVVSASNPYPVIVKIHP